MVEVKMNDKDKYEETFEVDHYKINARDFFVPTQVNIIQLSRKRHHVIIGYLINISSDKLLKKNLPFVWTGTEKVVEMIQVT